MFSVQSRLAEVRNNLPLLTSVLETWVRNEGSETIKSYRGGRQQKSLFDYLPLVG